MSTPSGINYDSLNTYGAQVSDAPPAPQVRPIDYDSLSKYGAQVSDAPPSQPAKQIDYDSLGKYGATVSDAAPAKAAARTINYDSLAKYGAQISDAPPSGAQAAAPSLPKGLDVPYWKPGMELSLDDEGDVSPRWDTPAQNALAAEYNRQLDAWKAQKSQPAIPLDSSAPYSPPPGLDRTSLWSTLQAPANLATREAAPYEPGPSKPITARIIPAIPIGPKDADRLIPLNPFLDPLGTLLDKNPALKAIADPYGALFSNNDPVHRPDMGSVSVRTLKTIANTVTGQVTPANALLALGSAGVGDMLVAAVNSAKAVSLLEAFPQLAKWAAVTAPALPAATFGGVQTYEASTAVRNYLGLKQQADGARQIGDEDKAASLDQKASDAAVSGATNLVMAALSFTGALATGKGAAAAFPPEASPSATFTNPITGGPGGTAADVGGLKAPPTPGAAAEQLEASGQRQAAQAWRNLDNTRPIPILMDGRTVYLLPPETTPNGRAYRAVVDANGKTLVGGTEYGVSAWLDQHNIQGPQFAISPNTGFPDIPLEPSSQFRLLGSDPATRIFTGEPSPNVATDPMFSEKVAYLREEMAKAASPEEAAFYQREIDALATTQVRSVMAQYDANTARSGAPPDTAENAPQQPPPPPGFRPVETAATETNPSATETTPPPPPGFRPVVAPAPASQPTGPTASANPDRTSGTTPTPQPAPQSQVPPQENPEEDNNPLVKGQPGWVGNIPTSEIKADPTRFQFKQNTGQGGAGEELRSVENWDPDKSGLSLVWKDPQDDQTYIINGHNRLALANRLDVPEMTVRYIGAQNAEEARTKGALANIAEGRGDATDAAKIFRDTQMTPEDIAAQGVSMTGKLAQQGIALANLSPKLFNAVISGDLPVERGAIIGAGVQNPADQEALYTLLQQREANGKRLTNDQAQELIRFANEAPKVTESTADQAQGGLFGDEEMTRSLLPEKAEVSDYVRKQLGAERKLFGTVSTQGAAEKLGETGNVIQAGQNAEVAQRANQGIALYDKLSARSGPIGSILDRAAQEVAGGKNVSESKQRAYREIRSELKFQIDKLSGVQGGSPSGSQGLNVEGSDQAGGGELSNFSSQSESAPPNEIGNSQENNTGEPSGVENSGAAEVRPPVQSGVAEPESPAAPQDESEKPSAAAAAGLSPQEIVEKLKQKRAASQKPAATPKEPTPEEKIAANNKRIAELEKQFQESKLRAMSSDDFAKVMAAPGKFDPATVRRIAAERGLTTAAKPNKPSAKQIADAAIAHRRDVYTPGNVIYVDYWKRHDKVLAYEEKPGGGFSVQVVESDKEGTPAPGARPRWHSTDPGRDIVVSRASAPAPNPFPSAADAERERLRAKFGTKKKEAPLQSRRPGQPAVDPDDLMGLATIGMEHMVNGAREYNEWTQRVMADVGDLVDAIAEASDQTPADLLREVHGYARAAVNGTDGIEIAPAPAKAEVPDRVKDRIKFALGELRKIAAALEQGRTLDSKFQGDGRYEWETWQGISDRDKILAESEKALEEFRRLAREKGIDPEQIIKELGGYQPSSFEPSDLALRWGGEKAPAAQLDRSLDELRRTGIGRYGDREVRIVQHPSVTGAYDTNATDFAVAIAASKPTPGRIIEVLPGIPLTFEQAMAKARDVLRAKISGPEATAPPDRTGGGKTGLAPSSNVPGSPESTSPGGAKALLEEVYQKLNSGESLGNVTQFMKLAEQHFGSSRTSGLWTPKDAFDAMEAGVNKYLLECGPELLAMDPAKALEELRGLMDQLPSQASVRTEEQLANQQFSTPPTESYVVAKVADLKPSDVVLEPSAGNGGLAVWPKSIGAQVYVNEISQRRREMLEAAGIGTASAHDGELINALLDPSIQPTVVLMNPPFSASTQKSHEAKNRNQYGFNHLDHALQRLQPGGRLVAILGGGRADDTNGGASLDTGPSGKWFDRIAQQYNVRANVRISGKEYQKYGTAFATRIIVIDKDGPTPSQTTPGKVKGWDGVVQGNAATLEEAYNLLKDVAASRPESGVEAGARGAVRPGQGQSSTGVAATPGQVRGGTPGVAGNPQGTGAAGQPAGSEQPGVPGSRNGDLRPGVNGQPDRGIEPGSESQGHPEVAAPGSPEGLVQDSDDEREASLALSNAPQPQEPNVEAESDPGPFVPYHPTIAGPNHPGDIVETRTMATVPLPAITYRPSLPPSVLENGRLSAVQLEAIAIAGQQNAITLPNGAYSTALIGDGTGVGKGRIAAGILFDNFRQGRTRLIWVSEKWDLLQDAIRDIRGIGATDLLRGVSQDAAGKNLLTSDGAIRRADQFGYGKPIEHKGVLFSTYALIRSENSKGQRRIDQLEQYLRGDDEGEGAYILFDESHNLKNAVAGAGNQESQIGRAVKGLLERNPKLRTASLSATAATDVINLGYLDRLGLWGPGTAFPNSFGQFQTEIAPGGIAAMEMIARELKAQGKYLSRTLSYKGVTYSTEKHNLSDDQKALYRTAAKAWASVVQQAEATIKNTTNGGGKQAGRFMAAFGGAQQRFFNLLITALKTPTAIDLANKALADGKSVVITLVNTNEAAQNREKAKGRAREDEGEEEPPDFDFGPKEMLVQLVRDNYPTQQYQDDVDSAGNPVKTPMYELDEQGRSIPVQNPEAVRARDALIAQLDRDLHMPENPLDILVNSLGGEKAVAEMTGRKEKYDASTGKFVARGDPAAKRDEINLYEMRAFQGGKKRVAVLSSAAGTGISLQAAHDAANQQKRYHITLQVGWSADKAQQMLGRTHRANQLHPPEYVFLVSDLAGEQRFVSTITRRIGSLGALTKGQKNAAAGSALGDSANIETEQGQQATNSFYTALLRNIPVPDTGLTGMQILTDLRVLKPGQNGGLTVPQSDRTNVTKLLNRLLALDPDVQNPTYQYFFDIFEAAVKQAAEDGTLDTGVKTLPGDEIQVKEGRSIAQDPHTGAETFYYPVDAKIRTDRVSPEELEDRMIQNQGRNVKLERNDQGAIAVTMDARPVVHANGSIEPASYVALPERGHWVRYPRAELFRKGFEEVGEWAKGEAEEAKAEVDRVQARIARYQADLNRSRDAARESHGSAARYDLRDATERLKRFDETPSEEYSETSRVDRRAKLEKDVERAQTSLEAAQKYELPAGDYRREMLAEEEGNLAKARKPYEEAQRIAQNPHQWAKDRWKESYEKAPSHITINHHLIGGAVMRYWNPIRDAARVRDSIYTAADTNTGQRVVGIDIPPQHIRGLLDRISGGRSTVNADQLSVDVMRNNMTYTLEGGIQVRRGRVARENVIQLIPPNPDIARVLTNLGIVYERGLQPVYYVPNAHVETVLRRVMEQYPVQAEPSLQSRALPGDQSLFSPQEEDEANASAKSHEARLLGDQLTAQIKSGMAAKPAKLKKAQNRSLFDEEEPEQTSLFGRAVPGFYSQLERTVADKMPAKASVAQILSIVKNPQNGVKADELKWTDLESWLMKQGGPVSKQDVLDYLKANETRVEEVVKGKNVDQARVAELTAELKQAKARAVSEEGSAFKVGDRVATVGAAKSIGGYQYSEGRVYEAVRNKDGILVWKAVDSFGGTRAGRSDKFIRELKEQAEHPWLETAYHNGPVSQTQGGRAAANEVGRVERELERAKEGTGVPTKFQQWKLPGGSNYREVLLTLPRETARDRLISELHGIDAAISAEPEQRERLLAQRRDVVAAIEGASSRDIGHYQSPHWDEPNVVAHTRMSDYVLPDGKRVSLMIENQSDWHEAGRKKGYQPSGEDAAKLNEQLATAEAAHSKSADALSKAKKGYKDLLPGKIGDPVFESLRKIALDDISVAERANGEAYTRVAALRAQLNHGTPDAPFSKTWHELVFRRMLRHAAEGGYDKFAWTTGTQQAALYNLAKSVDSIHYSKETGRLWAVKDGKDIISQQTRPEDLPDFIGKELAERLLNSPVDEGSYDRQSLAGKNLKVGGEGMKGFYDQIIPQYAARYVKKWGATVGETKLPGVGQKVHSIDITPSMRESVMQGQPLFARQQNPNQYSLFNERSTGPEDIQQPAQRKSAWQLSEKEIPHLPPAPRPTSNVPSLAEVRAYWTGARAQAANLGGRPALFVNNAAMDVMLQRMGQLGSGESSKYTLGVTITPADLRHFLAEANAAESSPRPGGFDDALADTASEVRKALGIPENERGFQGVGSKPLIVVQIPAGSNIADIKRIAEEEYDHALQMELPDRLRGLPMEIVDTPAGQTAANALRRAGYPRLDPASPFYAHNRSIIVAEIGARLMRPGRYAELGLDAQQARDLAREYTKALVEKHGPEAASSIVNQIYETYPEINPVDRRGQGSVQAESPASGQRAERGGDAEGVGQDVSGQPPGQGESLESRKPFDFVTKAPKDLAKLATQGVLPAMKAGTRTAAGSWDEIKKLLAPQTRGVEARRGYGLLRERNAELANRQDLAVEAIKGLENHFLSQPEELGVHGLNVIDAIEGGSVAGLAGDDAKFASVATKLLGEREAEIKRLKLLSHYLDNYFPHAYKDPVAAEAWVQNWQTKRPMAGSEAYRKQRSYPTLREALEDPNFHLAPKFNNPVGFLLDKLAEMDKSITAHDIFDELNGEHYFGDFHKRGAPRPTKDLQWVAAGQRNPLGFTDIDDRIFRAAGPRYGAVALPEAAEQAGIRPEDVRVFGKREMGHWAAPAPLSDVINNNLRPGIRSSDLMGALNGANRLMNMFELGWSYFHGMTTTLNSSVSDVALGMEQALAGKPLKAVGSMARGLTPFASAINDVFKGREIRRVLLGGKTGDPAMLGIAEALKRGGGRANADEFWTTKFTRSLVKSWKENDGVAALLAAGWKIPFAATELSLRPIMSYAVPRVKLAAFARLANLIIEQHPNMTRAEARQRFGEAWDSIDNRFGQLTQANLMMNPIVKDVMNAIVGRPGWNIGTVKEMGGGGLDLAKAAIDAARTPFGGKPPKFTHSAAFLLASFVVMAAFNAVLNRILTGEWPKDIHDYVAPRDGGVDEQGNATRIVLPFYLAKDVYNYATRPWQTIKAKAAPVIQMAGDLLENKNFQTLKIYGEHGEGVERYGLGQFEPYSIQGLEQNSENGLSTAGKILPFLGVMPAPKRMGMTDAQKYMADYAAEHGAAVKLQRTPREDAKRQITDALRSGDTEKAITIGQRAYAAGNLSVADVTEAERDAKVSRAIASFRRMPLDAEVAVVSLATHEERTKLLPPLLEKLRGRAFADLPSSDQQAIVEKLRASNITPEEVAAAEGTHSAPR